MLAFELSHIPILHRQVSFLYTFYQAGIVGGAFYAMNKLTKNQNMLEDFANGF